MAKYPKMTITNAGLDMIAESAADAKALIFTRVKLGDGSLTTQSIMDLTELVNEKMTVELSSGEAQAGGQTKLRFAVSNSGLDEGFFAREIGLYAKVGEDGTEGLYAYTNGASYVDYIPNKSNPLDAQVVDIYVVTANASSIKIEVSSAAYATVQDLVEHNAGVNSHPNGLTAPLMIWESGYTYKVNDVRVHEKKIWMCITPNSDVVFDKAKWESLGIDADDLTGKADTDLANIDSNLDVVVDSYSDAEGNWYRAYKSGWIEQGGISAYTQQGTNISVNLLKPYINDKYNIAFSYQDNISGTAGTTYNIAIRNITAMGFDYQGANGYAGRTIRWSCAGQGANV